MNQNTINANGVKIVKIYDGNGINAEDMIYKLIRLIFESNTRCDLNNGLRKKSL